MLYPLPSKSLMHVVPDAFTVAHSLLFLSIPISFPQILVTTGGPVWDGQYRLVPLCLVLSACPASLGV